MNKFIKTFICTAMILLPLNLGAQTFEGKGEASPEKAVQKYLEALKSCDYNKIISCYPVETYVENYDIEQMVKKLNCATPTMKIIYPKDNLLKQTAKFEVIDSITKMVKYQIWNICENDFLMDGEVLMVQDSTKNVVDKIYPNDAEKKLSHINLANVYSEEQMIAFIITGDFSSNVSEHEEYYEKIKKNLKSMQDKTKNIYGCKNIKDVTACFYVNGEKFYYFAETIQYGNKWYISPNQGYLASIFGISISSGCICIGKILEG